VGFLLHTFIPIQEYHNSPVDLIPNPPEGCFTNFGGALNRCRIVEGPVQALHVARKNRADFLSTVANRNDKIERLPDELIHGLGSVIGDIEPDFIHYRDRFRSHTSRVRASREDLKPIPALVTKKPFRHLAPGRISSAENKNPSFVADAHAFEP